MIKSVFDNKIIWYSLGSIMFALSSMLMLTVVGRVGGVQAVGEFGISYAVVQLLYIVGLFGVHHHQMTDYEKKYNFGSYALVKLATSLLMILGCVIVMVFSSGSYYRAMYTLLLTVYMLINSAAELYQSLFFQVDRVDLSGRSLFFRTLYSLIAFIVILYIGGSIIAALVAAIILNIAATLLIAVLPARTYIKKADYKTGFKHCRSLFIACIPLCASFFMGVLILNCVKYVIDFQGDDVIQGFLNIIFIPVHVIFLISSFIYKPQLIKYSTHIHSGDTNSFYRLLFKQMSFIAIIAIVCAVMGWIIGPLVLGLLFAVDVYIYRNEIALFIVGGGFLAISALLYYILIIFRIQKVLFSIYLIGSIISFLLGFVLIERFDMIGAAFSLLVTYIILTVLSFVFMQRSLSKVTLHE
ncbi:MAG: hypothetical protein LBD23_08005 [Oscillospiraceae bacterium]|jgi:O-antigen/teichoic acid export membrane protein|nr:hypothetical protein [Oscillospiraceae bacterium]